jgi:hypothetical protein
MALKIVRVSGLGFWTRSTVFSDQILKILRGNHGQRLHRGAEIVGLHAAVGTLGQVPLDAFAFVILQCAQQIQPERCAHVRVFTAGTGHPQMVDRSGQTVKSPR